MAVYSVYVVSRGGSLIYDKDYNVPKTDVEKTFSFPLDITLKVFDEKLAVDFGARDGIKVGHYLLAANGRPLRGCSFEDGTDVKEYLDDPQHYPISLKFGRLKPTTNEKIMLASMFHSLFAFGCQLSPEERSSGIQILEADTFKLHCMQTLTGIKFIVLTDPQLSYVDNLLNQLYKLYSDFALKNPYYSIDMPIRCDLFDENLKSYLEQYG
ncbi:trafficking protein particle complex subunit 4-like [Watersipora subatra]|uniref:trafficking protein particle complex subunit 4-like n=1 Tax=Watersipora subatra TaxID=2589382 RepID=UPI00355C6F63